MTQRTSAERGNLPHRAAGYEDTGEVSILATRTGDPSEKRALIEALRRTNGNQSQAARILGINRVTVWNRMKKYGIDLKKVLTA